MSTPSKAGDVQLLCNLNSPTEITLSHLQLKRIYTMKTKVWPDGTPITVYTLETGNPLHKAFAQELLKTDIYQLDRIWNRLTFSGQGKPPIILENETEMLENLKNTPGSIGYLSSKVNIDHALQTIQISGPQQ
ncbi:hypothetical protein [Thiomicrorhabdus sp.]|uniref:hypothetical protein n=1 Tax=Thiomicrorhabdus sp. TaxID=2039724 RepID=UPI0029C7319F|nr:hypothetical protein [Thiomicrorhabdus sp.]